jgi:hypothetical protein
MASVFGNEDYTSIGQSRASVNPVEQALSESAPTPLPKKEEAKPTPYTPGSGVTAAEMVEKGIPLPVGPMSLSKMQSLPAEVAREKLGSMSSEEPPMNQKNVSANTKTILTAVGQTDEMIDKYLKQYDTHIPTFTDELKAAKEMYQSKVTELGKENAIVSMFKILGHLAMGMYGAKHGVDTSNIKFEPLDWAAKQRQLMDEYRMETELSEGKYKTAESKQERMTNLIKWAREQAEQVERDRVRGVGGAIKAENLKKSMEAQLILKEGAAQQADIEKGAEQLRKDEAMGIKKGEKASDKAARLLKEEHKDIQSSLNMLASSKPGSPASLERTGIVAAKLGMPITTYEQFDETVGGDEEEWRAFVVGEATKRLTRGMPAASAVPQISSTPSSASGTITPTAPAGKVRVISPDGVPGSIDASRLEEFKSKGYKPI